MTKYTIVLLLMLFLTSCISIDSRTKIIGSVNLDQTESVLVPTQVKVNETFEVTIFTSVSDSCYETADVEKHKEDNTITLTPYNWKTSSGNQACLTAIFDLAHVVRLSFDTVGDYVIRVPGIKRSKDNPQIFIKAFIEKTVKVY